MKEGRPRAGALTRRSTAEIWDRREGCPKAAGRARAARYGAWFDSYTLQR